MSQFIKFYFTSSMLNRFRILIHPSSGACDFSILSPNWLCVLVSMCFGVSVWLGCASACNTNTIPTSYTETPTHIETRTHNQCGDTIEKSQVPDDGCINIRNMLSIEDAQLQNHHTCRAHLHKVALLVANKDRM